MAWFLGYDVMQDEALRGYETKNFQTLRPEYIDKAFEVISHLRSNGGSNKAKELLNTLFGIAYS